jgi:hypothetical protein
MEGATTPPVSLPRTGREGSRWFNVRPSAEEFITWCNDSIPMHDGLSIQRYIPGITLISQSEKEQAIVGWQGPKPVKEDVWHEVYVPYPKVETRVLYWQDWLKKGGGGEGDSKVEFFGVIEPVEPEEGNKALPAGFFSMTANNTPFMCCTMQAIVYDKKTVKREKILVDKRTGEERFVFVGEEIFRFTPATKQVPLIRTGRNNKSFADENALMKAETGAIGRALGLAGMLMVPGAGIASAEDIQELSVQAAAPAEAQQTLPMDARPADEQVGDLQKRAQELLNQLNAKSKEKVAEFQGWAKQRGVGSFTETDFGTIKTVVKKLEQMLAE